MSSQRRARPQRRSATSRLLASPQQFRVQQQQGDFSHTGMHSPPQYLKFDQDHNQGPNNGVGQSLGSRFNQSHGASGGIPPPGSKLVDILMRNEISEKQIIGMNLPNFILKHLSLEEIKDLKVMYDLFDCDHRESLNMNEFTSLLRMLGYGVTSEAEVEQKMEDIDQYNHQVVTFEMLLLFVVSDEHEKQPRDFCDDITHAYKLLMETPPIESNGEVAPSRAKDGKNMTPQTGITKDVLMEKLQISGRDAAEMMAVADLNGDGFVDENEFVKVMKRVLL